ncbi:MAG: GGDEF domain-containing protein, partial [Burkholderiaceae bacterium]|nr:GGDEF domain-containing protein [Burkholderiaceae bacterium]
YTRTAFFELASNLVGRHAARSCAIVMADIDRFKAINDTLGHAAGDTTLAHAARLIAGAVRLSDIVGRYGGEEFCILLPDCTSRQAGELAARLVDEAARQKVRHRDGLCIEYTISAGYAAADIPATLDDPTELLSALLEQADQALYRAKNEGRNRAVAAPEQVILNPAVRPRPRVSEEALAAR